MRAREKTMDNFEGVVGVVTGGGSGLGRAMALGLAKEGAKVLIAEVRGPQGQDTVQEIQSEGGKADLFVGDISQEITAEKLVNSCIQRMGSLDILINNAGLRMEEHEDGVYESWRCLPMQPTHKLPVDQWDSLLRVNLRAAFLCTHFALPHMIRQKKGTLISVSSGAGSRGVADKSAYCASKHAIEGFMKTVAEEVRQYGISANAIHPGGRANVDGRGGVPPDVVVPLILSLCGQDQPQVTGQIIKAKDWNEAQGGL